jgi:hypothetical protein
MRTLVLRIEKLERQAAQMRATGVQAFKNALGSFHTCCGASKFELLISALGAERTGRPLTEPEAAAKQEYWSYVKSEWLWPEVPMPATYPTEILLATAPTVVFAARWNLQRACSGYQAVEQGREPSEDELEAMQELHALNARVAELGGFDSVQEFNQFVEQNLTGDER